jgi:hypothetical protein
MISLQAHPHPSLSLDYEDEGKNFSLARLWKRARMTADFKSPTLTSILVLHWEKF